MFCQGRGYSGMHPPGQITYHFRPEKNGKQKPHHETTVEVAGNAPEFLSILNEVVYLKENYGRHYFSLN